jgi:hypothetical protein
LRIDYCGEAIRSGNIIEAKEITYCGGEILEGVGGETEEEAALADAGVADQEELEKVVELGLLAQAGRGGGGIHERDGIRRTGRLEEI